MAEGRLRPALPGAVATRLGEAAPGARLVLCAHSHLASLVRLSGGQIALNPGSVGCPAYADPAPPHPHVSEAGSPLARYAIVDIAEGAGAVTRCELLAVDYDYRSAARRALANDRPDWGRTLTTGWISDGTDAA